MHAHRLALVLAFLATLALPRAAAAQFGGDGRDGPFRPTSSVTLDTTARPDGWSFTSIDIPAGIDVRLVGSRPAILRSQGRVRIDGALRADGSASGTAGAGGYGGGYTSGDTTGNGLGPHPGRGVDLDPWTGGGGLRGCGGHRTSGFAALGAPYGSDLPFDLRGGSGGGGARQRLGGSLYNYMPGGGGGGTIALLADGDVEIAGLVSAVGGNGALPFLDGAGAGGSILVRGARDVTIRGRILAIGGAGSTFLVSGDGFIRIDAYGSPPVLDGTAEVLPAPRLEFLPHLTATTPTRGEEWTLEARSMPGDDVLFGFSSGAVSVPVPGLGLLGLDPNGGFFDLGILRVDAAGVDPIARVSIRLPDDPGLLGRPAVTQALTLRTSSPEGPRLSNTIQQTIR